MINKIFLCIALSNLSNTTMPMSKRGVSTACEQAAHIIETSEKIDVSPFVFSALIWHESRWLSNSVSKVRACGLTQVLDKYSDYSCKQLQNPKVSITEGASFLHTWLVKKKNIKISLKCYNSGYACSSHSYAQTILKKSELLKKEYLQVQKTIIGDNNE